MTITKKQALRQLKKEMGGYHEVALEETIVDLEKALKRKKKYYKNKYLQEKRKVDKAIHFIEANIVATETEDTLLSILKGECY